MFNQLLMVVNHWLRVTIRPGQLADVSTRLAPQGVAGNSVTLGVQRYNFVA